MFGNYIFCYVVSPNLTSWSNDYHSRLMFLIFADQSEFNDSADGLGLGIFFVFGTLLIILGIAILIKKYFSKKDNTHITKLS